MDFTADELNSGAAWMQTARSESIQQSLKSMAFNKQMQDTGLTQVNLGESAPDGDDDADGAKGYTWRQTDEEVEFTMMLPEGITAKALQVQILPKSLKVMIKMDGSVLKELKLFAAVR